MNDKRKMFLLTLGLCLALTTASLAGSGAPASQFGFSGWPYRQSSGCYTDSPSPTEPCQAAPMETALPTPTAEPADPLPQAPAERPTKAPVPCPTPTLEAMATAQPQESPAPESTPAPTQTPAATAVPERTAAPTQAPTATPAPTRAPTATKVPQTTEKPVETTPAPSTDEDYTTGSITAQEENAFALLSADRAANGRSALQLDPALCALARKKSNDMYQNNYFAHTSPTLGSAAQMLQSSGYAFAAVGENIAHHATVEKAQAAFMSSAGHRQNLLGTNWTKVGIGVCYDSQGFVYVTQLFVR